MIADSLKKKRVVAFKATKGLKNTFSEESRVKLFPHIIEEGKSDSHKVLRLGYRSAIGVRQIGVSTIDFLNQGLTIREVKEKLSQQYHCSIDSVKIEPLVQSLLKAGLVKSIDGKMIQVNKTNLLQYVGDVVRLYWKPKVRTLISAILFRYIPLQILRPSLLIINRIMESYKNKAGAGDCTVTEKAAQAGIQNLRNFFSCKLKKDELEQLLKDFRYYQEMTMVDGILGTIVAERWIRSRGWRSRKIEKWLWKLAGASSPTNLERLDLALKRNQGVILCGFHFGLVALMPILLSLRGYSLTSVGLVDTPELAKWHNTQLKGKLNKSEAVGDCTMLLLRDLETLQRTARLLKEGEIIVILAGGMVKALADFPKEAEIKAELLGKTVWTNSEIAWLYQQTGAPILPVKVIRKEKRGLPQLVIEPPLPLHGQVDIEEVTKVIYEKLENDILNYPAQWHNWSKLHRMWMRAKVK